MPSDRTAPEPARCAELIAPEIDRLRLGIASRMKVRGPAIAETHGLTPRALMAAGYVRNVYPDRSFDARGVLAVYTYQSTEQIHGGLDELITSGYLVATDDSHLRPTDAGRRMLSDMVSAWDEVAQELWPDTAALDRITPLAERAVAAIDDGGETFAVMAPTAGNPAGLSPAGWFGELLSGLRFHRFDCHIAAWRAAGLTAEEITQLEAGPEHDAIEADTNERAATPYRALTSAERGQLLEGVAALPD